MSYRSQSTNGGAVKVELWWWKDWAHRAGKYAVCLIDVMATEWHEIGQIQNAVVDDFGNLVRVPA